MGLFGNDKRDLEQALAQLRSDIGSNALYQDGPASSNFVLGSVQRVDAAASRLIGKGKGADVLSAIDAVYDTKPPVTVIGSSPDALASSGALDELARRAELANDDGPLPEIKGSGTAAQAEMERQAEIMKYRDANAYWRSILDGVRARVSGS